MDERTEKNKKWCTELMIGFHKSCETCGFGHLDPCYYEELREKYKKYKTVEEVEEVRCKKCSRTGHWGWCDSPITGCVARDRIKDILGIPLDKYGMTAEQDINRVLEGSD